MKAGVIGIPSDDFGAFDSFQIDVEGTGLQQHVEVRKERKLQSGHKVLTGAAAKENWTTNNSYEITDQGIKESESEDKSTNYTEFIAVPGEFVIVDSSSGDFAFDLIGRRVSTFIERAAIDISGFLDETETPNPWKVGFCDHFGNADNGILYGNDLLDDGEMGDVLGVSDKNQLGITYTGPDGETKVNLTRSGYIEVYKPKYDSEEFAEFVLAEVSNHLRVGQEDQ